MRLKLGRNAPCWCGSGKKYKFCHEAFDERLRRLSDEGHEVPTRDLIKTPEQIDGIRESGKINIAVLDAVAAAIREGMSTQDIDDIVAAKTAELGGIPATLNYEGYPKSCCTSVNDEICHGIPSKDVILQDGDILSVDVSTIYKGYFSDSCRMFCIGNVPDESRELVRVAKECIEKGLEQVKPWGYLGDMGEAVNAWARAHGYSVVEDIGGHGVGLEFHEDPFVSYVSTRGTEMVMAPGMVFTIEPMVNAGTEEYCEDEENGWTVYTWDGKDSAQWEVMVAITGDGYEILAY